MPDFRAPRIRMPRVTLPGRAGGTGARTKELAKAGNGKPETATKEAAKPAAATPAKGKAPDPNLQERMEGLQGWMAEIERKQGRITYFGLAGLVIAILAAGAALYFGLTTKSDSATKSDLDALSKRIDSLEAAATKNSKDTQAALNSSVSQLQQSISTLQTQQSQNSSKIATLESQASAGAFGKGAAAGTTVTPTPGITTTTPTPKPNGK